MSYVLSDEKNKMLKENEEAIAELESKKKALGTKYEALDIRYKDKLDISKQAKRKIDSAKNCSKKLLLMGAIVAVVGILVGLVSNIFVSIVGGALGILLCVLGIKKQSSVKALKKNYDDSEESLTDYYEEWNKINTEEEKIDAEINKHKSIVTSIKKEKVLAEQKLKAEREAAEKSKFFASLSTKHLVVYGTSEYNAFDLAPKEPVAKKYDSLTLENIQIYINGMLYGTAVSKYGSGAFTDIEVDESGTLRTEFIINFKIASNRFNRQSDPLPFKLEARSKFCWFHVSTCSRGTQVFFNQYDDIDDFFKATGLTKAVFNK